MLENTYLFREEFVALMAFKDSFEQNFVKRVSLFFLF